MDYNDVPVFVRVVETGSFTRAAHVLGLQKSSVSRTIGRLESELGVRLLQRTTRQLSLTDAGQQFYDAVRSALTHVDDAVATVRELGGEPRGLIRMTAPSGADVLGLADMIVEFGQRYPAISIDIVLTGRFVDLVSEGFDLAIRARQLEDSQLVATRIMMSGQVLFAAPSYLDKRGRPATLEQLAEHDCILFKGRSGSSVWPLTGPDGVEREVEVTGALSVDELSFAMRASQAGAGIALLPPEIAAPAAMSGALEVLLPNYYRRVGPLHIVLPSAAFIPSRVALFRDHLVERLQQMSARVHAQCTKHTKTSEAASSDRGAGAAG